MPSFRRPPPSGLRRMPAWLAASPWLVVACSLLLAAVVLVLDFRKDGRESEITTRIFLERGASLIHAYEATLRTGMGFRWTDEELQGVLDRLGTSPDVHYVAITDEEGRVFAASDASLLGTSLVTPREMEKLHPVRRPRGRIVTFPRDGGSAIDIFQVYQELAVQQYEQRLRDPRHMRGHHMMRAAGTPIPSQRLIVFIGYDLTPLIVAEEADSRQALVHGLVLAFLGAVGLLTLLLVKGYQRSRLLVQETSAFSFALVDALPLGIIAVDETNRITTFNPEAERITGLIGSDIQGENLADVLPGLWAVLRDTGMHDDASAAGEQEIRCDFGRHRVPLALTAIAIQTETGNATGHAFMLRDLGEIRRLQAEIRRQDRLAALGNMAAGIAHEIRNPLGAIKGLARFFREISAEDSEEARMADIMTREVQRLDNVVGDLLELARPDRLRLAPVEPAALLDRVRRLIQADMDKAGVRYEEDVSPLCPRICLDEDRITQALLNLYLNAIQAMPRGGMLRVSARLSPPPGAERAESSDQSSETGHIPPSLALSVEDTGEGIPRDKQQDIFSPYYTTKARGTGLGLSLVLKIVEAHDGEIEVRSAPGQGTRFTLRLPLPPDQTGRSPEGACA